MDITNEQILKEIKKSRKEMRENQKNVTVWLLVIIALMFIFTFVQPVNAVSLIPFTDLNCNGHQICNLGNIQDGSTTGDWGVFSKYQSSMQIRLRLDGSYNISSMDLYTKDCYQPDDWNWKIYTLNATEPNGYCPTVIQAAGSSTGWTILPVIGSNKPSCGSHFIINYTPNVAGRCVYVASDWYGARNYWGITELQFWGSQTYSDPVPFSATFTAVPQSGNQSLNVQFTPVILGQMNGSSIINRVVWDYDGGLGTETKYTGFNDVFNKTYNTAGHFIARLSAYDTSGNVITASKNIDVYNYTLGITPTPTLTPIPTSTPQTNTSGVIKVSSYDALNNTPLSSPTYSLIDTSDVGSGWFNVTASSGDYTFNGYSSGGSKPLVSGHNYAVVVNKLGYETKWYLPPNAYSGLQEHWSIPVQPAVYIPSASTFTLYIPMYDSTTTDLIGFKSGSVIISNQSSTWTSSASSIHDAVTFAGLTPSDSYKIDISIQGYEHYTGYFASSSGMAGSYQTYVAMLIPTTVQPSQYTLTISPNTGTVNDTYSLSLSPTISGTTIKRVSIKYTSSTSAPLNMKSGSGYTEYAYVTGAWKQWDGSAFTLSGSPASAISAKFNNLQNPASDNVIVTAYITDNNDNTQQVSATISLISQGNNFAAIWAFDNSQSGGGTAYRAPMMSYTSHIYNVYTNEWTNTSYTASNYYAANYPYVTGTLINCYASADGYPDTSIQSKVLSGTENIEYVFYAPKIVPIGNATLYAHTITQSGQSIPNARIVFSEYGNMSGNCFTNSGGSCGISVISGTTYTASASAYGYMGATGSQLVSNSTGTNVIELVLIKSSSLPTTTSAYDRPTTISTIPTFTGYNGTNASMPWGNQVEYSCSVKSGDISGGVLGTLMNLISCMGVKGAVNQGLALYIIVTCGIALYLSRYAKGMGVMAGVIVGTSAALVMNLIPFWILIFVIIVCGLAFASLMGQGPDK